MFCKYLLYILCLKLFLDEFLMLKFFSLLLMILFICLKKDFGIVLRIFSCVIVDLINGLIREKFKFFFWKSLDRCERMGKMFDIMYKLVIN